jgi:large subunit ribosomal protein L25
MSTSIQALPRNTSTKAQLRLLRGEGKVPGVVYGKEIAAASAIAIDSKDLMTLLRGNPHSILELNVPEQGNRSVLLTDIQRDSLSGQVLHVDFHQINLNEKIKAVVRLDVRGESPGEKEGGMLQLVLHELEIECVAKDLPSSIAVEIGSLGIGDHVTVGDLRLPAGVTTTVDAEAVVASVLAPQKERSEAELDAMDDAAEENEAHARAAQAVETD